jgi:LCP family protein required for cell wall assembly
VSDTSLGRHRGRAGRRHGILRVFGYGILTMTLCLGLFGAYTYRHLNENLTNLNLDEQLGDRPEKVVDKGDGKPLNVLVMGSDSRSGEGNDSIGGPEDGKRSDTTILMHVSGDRSFAYGVSIPRDSMVDRPECYDEDMTTIPGEFGMWNKAFDEAGPGCTIRQFEQLTGIFVDHFVVVDFNGFKGMVDALDGVDICLPEDVSDPVGNIELEAGTRTVMGEEALDYVRVRHGIGDIPNGDIGRMKRQQTFVAAMANKVMSKGMLARPDRLISFLNAATQSLTLDQELDSVLKIAELGAQFQDIGLDKIKFVTVPFEVYEPDRNRVIWTEEAEDLWELIRTDQPLSERLSAEAITAANEPGTPAGPEDPSESASPDGEESPTDEPSDGASDEPTDEETESLAPDPEVIAANNGLC